MIMSNVDILRERWGEAADTVIAECSKVNFNGNSSEFLDHCTACGGNWGGMLSTGIKALFPSVYAALPEKLGRNGVEAFDSLVIVLNLCGVNTAE
jgi:hypothetical protein